MAAGQSPESFEVAAMASSTSSPRPREKMQRSVTNKYLLLEDKYGKRKGHSSMARQIIESEIQLLKGSLFVECSKSDNKLVDKKLLVSMEKEDVTLECPLSDLLQLTTEEANLLLAVTTRTDRMKILTDDEWLKEGKTLSIGSEVDVCLRDHSSYHHANGVVRYKGPISGYHGTMFGVELLTHRNRGTTDGVVKKKEYFKCPLNSGVFLPLSQVRKRTTRRAENSKKPPLEVNDRIVWMADDGPEYGVVRWIGVIPEEGSDLTVGVEFDKPIGTGTGRYLDRQLFKTKPGYASLIPILGLMKEEEFLQMAGPSEVTGAKLVQEQEEILKQFTGETKKHQHSKSRNANALNKSSEHSADQSYEEEVKDQEAVRNSTSQEHPVAFPAINSDLEVGSMVEVSMGGVPKYGVIRWIGYVPDASKSKPMAGVEMDEEDMGCTDGSFNDRRYFSCPPRKAFFLYLHLCKKDSRFLENPKSIIQTPSAAFGNMESPVIPGDVPPMVISSVDQICGKHRGIQGHHNSCYLDATLFSMFSCTQVFDTMLFRPRYNDDLDKYEEVQKVLKEEIVNPFRLNMYVRADRVLKLRTLLDQLTSVSGLMSEEKDPEEFLNSLNQIFKCEPFLKLSSGQESHVYQVFMERDDKIVLPTVQQLFEESFLTNDLKLKEIPPCFIIQMPRFGKDYKMYKRIAPSLVLDITDVLENSPRQCSICGMLAEYECRDCFRQFGEGLEGISFCRKCVTQSHSHSKRQEHKPREIGTPDEFKEFVREQASHGWHHAKIPRVHLELFAVVCIATSHYVAYVKCGNGLEAPWIFFDSMADRKGGLHGYNIPEVRACPNLTFWLSNEGYNCILKNEEPLPNYAQRLLSDGYICFYQSPELMMYR